MEDFDLAHRLKQPSPQQRVMMSASADGEANLYVPSCLEAGACRNLAAYSRSAIVLGRFLRICMMPTLRRHWLCAGLQGCASRQRRGVWGRVLVESDLVIRNVIPVAEADTEERKRLRNQEEEVMPVPSVSAHDMRWRACRQELQTVKRQKQEAVELEVRATEAASAPLT